ncbi:MAG: MarC family protein [Bdellovibrionota bacterium]
MYVDIFSLTLRYFFLFTPFFALMMFLYLTKNFDEERRKKDATKIMITSFVVCVIMIFLGSQIFSILGITVNAFRVGVGTILLLDGIGLVKGRVSAPKNEDKEQEIVLVPMTIPIIIGPAMIGTLLVAGTDTAGSIEQRLVHIIALLVTSVLVWLLLYLSVSIEKSFGKKRIIVLSKITGIYLAALASQMIMQGISEQFFLK